MSMGAHMLPNRTRFIGYTLVPLPFIMHLLVMSSVRRIQQIMDITFCTGYGFAFYRKRLWFIHPPFTDLFKKRKVDNRHGYNFWVLLSYFIKLHETGLAMIFSFLSGGIIMNVLKEELPEHRERNAFAFWAGAI